VLEHRREVTWRDICDWKALLITNIETEIVDIHLWVGLKVSIEGCMSLKLPFVKLTEADWELFVFIAYDRPLWNTIYTQDTVIMLD